MKFLGYYIKKEALQRVRRGLPYNLERLIMDSALDENLVTETENGIDILIRKNNSQMTFTIHFLNDEVVKYKKYSKTAWNNYPECLPPDYEQIAFDSKDGNSFIGHYSKNEHRFYPSDECYDYFSEIEDEENRPIEVTRFRLWN